MAVANLTIVMHCPKCGLNYPDGSQRFCDIDGARLASTGSEPNRGSTKNVFSSILPIGGSDAARDETPDLEPRFAVPDYEKVTDHDSSGLFFDDDEDDLDFEGESEPVFEIVDDPPVERIFGRKINPYEIPAGHVEVGEVGTREHPSIQNLDFDDADPKAFVGCTVKGRYHVTDLIGGDDTGFAFMADDRLVEDKRVVVRILNNENFDEVTESIFSEERVTLSHLNHPNIVRLIDSGQFVDGTTFLISEHIDGLSVNDVLKIHGPFEPMRAARIIRQAGNALSDVHAEGILHRDLRPDYIVVTPTDTDSELVKLSNFGVSDGEPNADNLIYKSPEVLDARVPNTASDVYSLGAVAFQMLTGKAPFDGETDREILRSQRAGYKKHAGDLRPGLATGVDEVFAKVLDPDPLERYSTAREFGEVLFGVLAETADQPAVADAITPTGDVVSKTSDSAAANSAPAEDDFLAWTRRSPEPPVESGSRWFKLARIGALVLLAGALLVWYFAINRPVEPDIPVPADPSNQPNTKPPEVPGQAQRDIEVPPLARSITQPPDTDFFQTNKQDLRGDLLRNYLAFSLYYPKSWKVTGPRESLDRKTRGKFLDIARNTADGKLQEQMLVSYYSSSGTMKEDAAKFPELVKETNQTLKDLIPNYQMVFEGSTTVNGGWNAYEIRFQGSVPTDSGERLLVWGRRLFIPAARPGVRAGFEITMLATSYAEEVRSVDDVGTKGELASILYTFEPSQNF